MTTYNVEGSPEEIWLCDGEYVLATFRKEGYVWVQDADGSRCIRKHMSLKFIVERVVSLQPSDTGRPHKIFVRSGLVPFYN